MPEAALHAACAALGGVGVLIRGPSGAGKSSLALLLAAAPDGALVADDRVACAARDGRLAAAPHPAVAGLVEVRGQGILRASDLGLPVLAEAWVGLCADLVEESPRLPPPPDDAELCGVRLPRLVLDRGARAAGLAPLLVRAALRRAAADSAGPDRASVTSRPHNPAESPGRGPARSAGPGGVA